MTSFAASALMKLHLPHDESVAARNKSRCPRNASRAKEFTWNAPCILLQVQSASHAQHSQLRSDLHRPFLTAQGESASSIGMALSERQVLCDLKLSSKHIFRSFYDGAHAMLIYTRDTFTSFSSKHTYTSRVYIDRRDVYSRANSRGWCSEYILRITLTDF